MVIKGRTGPHHRVEFEDRSSGWAVSPEHSSQSLVAVEGPSQPLNPFVKIKPFVHSGVCFHKSFSYPRNAKSGVLPAA